MKFLTYLEKIIFIDISVLEPRSERYCPGLFTEFSFLLKPHRQVHPQLSDLLSKPLGLKIILSIQIHPRGRQIGQLEYFPTTKKKDCTVKAIEI